MFIGWILNVICLMFLMVLLGVMIRKEGPEEAPSPDAVIGLFVITGLFVCIPYLLFVLCFCSFLVWIGYYISGDKKDAM